jgi:hypothetical protein
MKQFYAAFLSSNSVPENTGNGISEPNVSIFSAVTCARTSLVERLITGYLVSSLPNFVFFVQQNSIFTYKYVAHM